MPIYQKTLRLYEFCIYYSDSWVKDDNKFIDNQKVKVAGWGRIYSEIRPAPDSNNADPDVTSTSCMTTGQGPPDTQFRPCNISDVNCYNI